MITCNPQEVATVNVTSLSPGNLFAYAGSDGKLMAMVVENDGEGRFLSWLHLTGPHAFAMDCMDGRRAMGSSFKVFRIPLKLRDLRLQIEPSCISRKAEHIVGSLLVDEQPRIITAFISQDGSGVDADQWAVSLHDFARDRPGSGYACDEWRLVNVPESLPLEVIAQFGGH